MRSPTPALHRWSIEDPGAFWAAIWDLGGLGPHRGPLGDLGGGVAAAPSFFPDGRLNVADVLLGEPSERDAFVAIGEDGTRRALTRRELVRRRSGRGGRAARRWRASGRPGRRRRAVLDRVRRHRSRRGRGRRHVRKCLTRLRRGRVGRPVRPTRSGGARHDRSSTRTPAQQHDTVARATHPGRATRRPAGRDDRRPRRRRWPGGVWVEWDAWVGGATPCAEFDAVPLRPAVVRAVLVGHHRQAESDRPPRRWRAAQAPERAHPAHRHPPR